MVEPGTAIIVSVRLGRLLRHCFPHNVLFYRGRTWESMLHVFTDL